MFRKILLAYDGSDGAKRALEVAIDVAGKYNSELWAVSVNELDYYASTRPIEHRILDMQSDVYANDLREAAAVARRKGIELKTKVLSGNAAQCIVDFAKENAFELIVAGQMGRSGLFRLLLGSTSERISQYSSCTVMIVK
jgi:nucleotide-binding universal stress UspA family protein